MRPHDQAPGGNCCNLLIMGCDRSANDVISVIAAKPSAGYKVIGCLAENQQQATEMGIKAKVIGSYDDLKQILLCEAVDELILTARIEKAPGFVDYIRIACEMGIAVRILPSWSFLTLSAISRIGKLRQNNLLGIPALDIDSPPVNRGEMVVKAVFDYSFAIAGIVLTLPIWIIAAAGIKLVSPRGPVLYSQTRLGQNGRKFYLHKFRTMIPNAESLLEQYANQNECDGPVFKIKSDPRVLPYIGPLLRKTSLDELPQLINVLKGELSIVGPRPPLPREVECYQPWQRRRLSMKPGITCFWQTQPNRNDIGFNEWVKMDLAYIDNWSLWLDFKIMLRTAWAMLIGSGR